MLQGVRCTPVVTKRRRHDVTHIQRPDLHVVTREQHGLWLVFECEAVQRDRAEESRERDACLGAELSSVEDAFLDKLIVDALSLETVTQ